MGLEPTSDFLLPDIYKHEFDQTALIIGFGGFLGSISRYITQLATSRVMPSIFPYGTFVVNIIGCFLIGVFYGLAEREHLLSPQLRLFFVVGFIGSYTTFSTFSMDKWNLIQNGHYVTTFGYLFLSVILGLAGTVSGIFIIKKILTNIRILI